MHSKVIILILVLFLFYFENCTTSIIDNCIETEEVDSGLKFYHQRPKVTLQEQNLAVRNLIQRILGENLSKQFNVTVSSALTDSDNDAFHIFKKGGSIVTVVGSTSVAAAAGFHYYLKHFLNCHVSWDYNQLELPSQLPDVDVYVKYPERFRLFQNVCTASYSYVWWDWSQWEKEIDRWALNGINLAYAFTGEEAVWSKIYKSIGLNKSEIDDYFTGPAFLAWNRMGNIRGWMGPLSAGWLTRQTILQRKIVFRMRELSITPILPAFSGLVPQAFKRIFPNSKLTKTSCWNEFGEKYCCPFMLDPTDPLFKMIGSKFIRELIAQFGTNHVYSADTFNENHPQNTDLEYLKTVSGSIYASMTSVDSKAVWVLQGWMFVSDLLYWTEERVESFLTAVPLGKIIVLDLFAEQMPSHKRLKSYFGQPYIWCMLHNFGGTLGLHGSLPSVNEGVLEARNDNQSLIGLGMVPEGINQNYVVYDFMSDVFWSKTPINLDTWMENYSIRRYGSGAHTNIIQTWKILKDTVYSYNGSLGALHGRYKITRRPSLEWTPEIWFDSQLFFEAVGLFLSTPLNSTNYVYDVVDFTREVLQILFSNKFDDLLSAVHAKNVVDFQNSNKVLISILQDLESILATEKKFLLGAWLKPVKAAATNTLEEHVFESNARTQITIWGPNGPHSILDYATKQFSGIVSDYYLPRWNLFLSQINSSLLNNVSFNQEYYNKEVFQTVEHPFTVNINQFPDTPIGDSYENAKRIFNFWFPS